jgi:preprotein translocase subunit SecE
VATRPSSGAPAFRRPSQGESRGFKPIGFIQDVVSELRKAVWPSRDETFRLTWVVLIIGGFVGLMLGLFDFTISHTLTKYVILP